MAFIHRLGTVLGALAGLTLASGSFATPLTLTPVALDSGPVQGVEASSTVSYKGIPFAAPPVGALRWAPPNPVTPWTNSRVSDHFGPGCPQTPMKVSALVMNGGDTGATSEDCLYLNVWAPKAPPPAGQHYPVMVWLHGGGLKLGSGSIPWYDGTHFAEDGVVLVTLNYRLGPLGWFAHPALTAAAKAKGEAFGNYGLMDQIAALKWVQRNIGAFGGDPTNVTVFGESAGGFSVLMLLSTPAAQGLYAKAIIESGGSGYAMPLAEAEAKGASFLGADLSLDQLRALPLDKINTMEGAANSGEIIDGQLLTETPAASMLNKRAAKVPLIIGSNSGEDSLLRDTPDAQAHLFSLIPPDRLAAVRAAYGEDGKSDRRFAHALFTDLHMGAPAHDFAAAASAGAPTYLYHFDYVPGSLKLFLPRAVHGMEIFFVFETQDKTPVPALISDADRAEGRLVHGCWVAFAKTGKPDCGVPWPAYDPSQDALLYFGKDNGVKSGFRKDAYTALRGIWPVW